jgi:hypothetical protein
MSLILSGTEGISGSAGVIDAETFAGQANTYYTDISARLGYTPLSNVNPSYSGTLTGNTGIINIGSGQIYKDASGQVGIGTSSITPIYGKTLQIGSGASEGSLSIVGSTGAGYVATVDSAFTFAGRGGMVVAFNTNDVERMRIDSSGNLLVGTTGAVERLTIGSGSSTSSGINLRTTQTDFSIIPSNSAAGGVTIATSWVTGGQGPLKFNNASGEIARFDPSGNLGLGAVPVAGYGNSIQIGSSGAYASLVLQSVDTDIKRMYLLNNAIPPAGGYTGGFNYQNTGASATGYLQETGAHKWFTAPVGTAGNAISFTQAMTLNAAGTLLIGTGTSVTEVKPKALLFYNTGSSDGLIQSADDSSTFTSMGINKTELKFYTNNTERMRITSGGNVNIGRSTSGSPGLSVAATTNISFSEDSDGQSIATMFRQSSSGSLVLGSGVSYSSTANAFASSMSAAWARSAVNVGYGAIRFFVAAEATASVGSTVTMTERVTITTTGLSATSITETSSIVYKENVNPIMQALDAIVQLTGVTYDRKDGSRTNEAGLIAEEVNKVLPNIVTKNDEGNPEGIQYTKLTAYLIECIKELKSEIDILKGK